VKYSPFLKWCDPGRRNYDPAYPVLRRRPLFAGLQVAPSRGPKSRKQGPNSDSRGYFHIGEKRDQTGPIGRPLSIPYDLWHVEIERRLIFGRCDPGIGTYDPAYPVLRRKSSRKRAPGDQKSAKKAALLHTFPGIARYSQFKANRAFCADVQNAFVRFWEVKPGAGWIRAGPDEKRGCFGGPLKHVSRGYPCNSSTPSDLWENKKSCETVNNSRRSARQYCRDPYPRNQQ
jgi:hypothetical protein